MYILQGELTLSSDVLIIDEMVGKKIIKENFKEQEVKMLWTDGKPLYIIYPKR